MSSAIIKVRTVRPFKSCWPLHMVRKGTGWRPFGDYRRLNGRIYSRNGLSHAGTNASIRLITQGNVYPSIKKDYGHAATIQIVSAQRLVDTLCHIQDYLHCQI